MARWFCILLVISLFLFCKFVWYSSLLFQDRFKYLVFSSKFILEENNVFLVSIAFLTVFQTCERGFQVCSERFNFNWKVLTNHSSYNLSILPTGLLFLTYFYFLKIHYCWFENVPIYLSSNENNTSKISHWNTLFVLRYVKSLFTNIQKQ